MGLPATGMSAEAIAAALEDFGKRDLPWREGGTFAYVYEGGREVEAIIHQAYMRYLTENALDPTVYPSLLKFEREIVAIARDHLGGDDKVVGNFTTGGTESCMLAVKTARDFARATRGIARPELVLPVTAHACFHKAAQYFDMPLRLVEVDTASWKVSPQAMAAAITPDTAMIVGSACQYAHGVIDPIPELGALALERHVLLHVDGCIGGWILPFLRRLGQTVPAFGFEVPGVTSISMDFHKYGYAAKGASVILHRNKDLRRHQIFTGANWTGYSVINPTMLSSKSGGPLAACWAVLNHLGDAGYMEFARRTLAATQAIAASLRAHPDVELLAEPESCLIAFAGKGFSPFPIVDAMRRRGWFVQPQLGYMGSRANIHLSIDQSTIDVVDRFLPDLDASIAEARGLNMALPEPVKALLGSLTADQFTPQLYGQLMGMGGADGGLPEGTTGINMMLDAMQPEVAARVMTEFFNDLYV